VGHCEYKELESSVKQVQKRMVELECRGMQMSTPEGILVLQK